MNGSQSFLDKWSHSLERVLYKKIKGETELIRTYLAPLAQENQGACGLLDDCAILKPLDGTELIISTDAVAEGVHFFSDDKPEDIGWKALAISVSDLAAKAAKPLIYQLAVSFPEPPTHKFMTRLVKGLDEAQRTFGIHLSGGDSDLRPGPLSLTLTVIGHASQNGMIARKGASFEDDIFISGTLGEAALGLKLRRKDRNTKKWNLKRAETKELLRRYLRPTPRLDLRDLLEEFASSAIDLSDGFHKDLISLCAANGCGAEIKISCLPLSPIVRKILKFDPMAMNVLLSGGDDYEILFTVPKNKCDEILKKSKRSGLAVTKIGHLTKGGKVHLFDEKGKVMLMKHTGWDHFA